MGVTNGYVTLADLKSINEIEDDRDDAILEKAIESISRFIDQTTWRRFFSATETRYYTPGESVLLLIDDLTSITSLKTDEDGDRVYEITWSNTDYDLLPLNAVLDGLPWTEIHTTPNGDYSFPLIARSIELAGDFGYVADGEDAPWQIRDACILGCNRITERYKTPLGVAGSASLGELRIVVKNLKNDPDFMDLINPFSKGFD